MVFSVSGRRRGGRSLEIRAPSLGNVRRRLAPLVVVDGAHRGREVAPLKGCEVIIMVICFYSLFLYSFTAISLVIYIIYIYSLNSHIIVIPWLPMDVKLMFEAIRLSATSKSIRNRHESAKNSQRRARPPPDRQSDNFLGSERCAQRNEPCSFNVPSCY